MIIADIHKLEQRIRDLINRPRKQRNIMLDQNAWHRLCSSMDLIGDTQLAIESFDESSISGELLDGYGYLIIYGLLQALFLQQDAARDLALALKYKFELPKELGQIREIRNDTTGHPTDRKHGEYFCVINRSSIHGSRFSYFRYSQGKNWFDNHNVDVSSLISTQRNVIGQLLTEIIERLEIEEKKHRSIFREVKMLEIFPQTLHYYFQKMDEAIHEVRSFSLGSMHIELVEDIINHFEDELKKREEYDGADWYEYHRKKIDYPLTQLKSFFKSEETCEINEQTASIFVWFLQKELDELRMVAKEIDEEYESEDI